MECIDDLTQKALLIQKVKVWHEGLLYLLPLVKLLRITMQSKDG
jgi:hypothetical protein